MKIDVEILAPGLGDSERRALTAAIVARVPALNVAPEPEPEPGPEPEPEAYDLVLTDTEGEDVSEQILLASGLG